SAPAASRSTTTTFAPWRAKAADVARPIPLPPPVMSATLPVKSILIASARCFTRNELPSMRLARRRPIEKLLDAIIVERAGLGIARQAEVEDFLRDILRHIERHRVLARHCGRAHAC